MPFLDEIDSIRSKLHLSGLNRKTIIGLVVVLGIVTFLIFQVVWSLVQPHSIGDESQAEEITVEEVNEPVSSVFVHVTGCVNKPGLYELPEGARVKEAIDAAGGFSDNALMESINLARVICDGEQIVVGDKTLSASTNTSSAPAVEPSETSNGKISINTASAEELMELDGVGEATAEKIIAYRQENGGFQKLEDLLNVSGIGEKKFEAMKDQIVL